MPNTKVSIAGVELKNPVTVASGTFGFGREFAKFYDLSRLGAISVKGLTLQERQGNPPQRIAETPMGLLNSIGLQNPGVDAFLKEELPFLKQFDVKIIANIAGSDISDYCRMAEKLAGSGVDLIEMNISCPNVKEGGVAFGTDAETVHDITMQVKRFAGQPVIVKLSPNVTDITEMAQAAEAGGADALSLINTLLGMRIDVNTRRPILYNNVGGLSGPAVKPVAVRMVWQVAQKVKLPIIGMGGITTGEDAAEFLLAGATAVSIGTANLVDPMAAPRILEELEQYLDRQGIDDVRELRGAVLPY